MSNETMINPINNSNSTVINSELKPNNATVINTEISNLSNIAEGTTLCDKYKVESKLDINTGEADLYVCDYNGEKFIAKIYRRKFAVKPEVTNILKQIDSPYIAKLYETGTINGMPFEILPYYKNGSIQGRKFTYEELKNNIIPCINAGLKAFTAMMTVIVMVVGGIMISTGNLSVADMLAFLLYINVLTEPIKTLIDFTEMFQNGYSGFERFTEILDIFPDIQDKPGAKDFKDVRGDVTFENVEFRYGERNEIVFSNINMDVPAGSYYAIVGPSGIGKTTMVSLIPRFYDISDGSIKIDGTDIRDVTQKSLRDNIGVVQQDVYLFIGTVYENILYGRPDATREEVIEAAKNANAHDFIMELPDGYDTDIGQRGVKLSGGQKQRLSIARVFLKNPPILIFDEATSALDNESEKIVQESMDRLAQNRTTFVIAHRLTTVRNAEKILEMTKTGIKEWETEDFFANIP